MCDKGFLQKHLRLSWADENLTLTRQTQQLTHISLWKSSCLLHVFRSSFFKSFDRNVAEICAKNIFHMKTENDICLWFSFNLHLPQTNAHTDAVNAADSPRTLHLSLVRAFSVWQQMLHLAVRALHMTSTVSHLQNGPVNDGWLIS